MPVSFPPIEPTDCRVLILGTMPSVQSLQKKQYYGHPRNQFWPLLFALWGLQAPPAYSQRVAFLYEKRIALWDVLQSCDRQGSLDSSITRPAPNDLAGLIRRHPTLQGVCFNSANAAAFFRRLVGETPKQPAYWIALPSSSPARAMRFADKLEQWRPVRRLVEEGRP
ncbi:MAG TPA: DNA-deoxyinosine glycosylase [Candidatus Gallacutalibacter stercoravium]|nr:DNA-deoxyinosine glycosylase [Candidatus Gallacutalibacter stercoravium]